MILSILTHILAIVLGALALLALLVALSDDDARQDYLENTDRRLRR